MYEPEFGSFCSHSVAAKLALAWVQANDLMDCQAWAARHQLRQPQTLQEAACIRQAYIEQYGLLSALQE
jgi:hypothetical protein